MRLTEGMDDLERAAERFADTVHADVSAQVRLAWALERDRLYAEIAELRDEVHALATDQHALFRGSQLQADVAELRDEVHALGGRLANVQDVLRDYGPELYELLKLHSVEP